MLLLFSALVVVVLDPMNRDEASMNGREGSVLNVVEDGVEAKEAGSRLRKTEVSWSRLGQPYPGFGTRYGSLMRLGTRCSVATGCTTYLYSTRFPCFFFL